MPGKRIDKYELGKTLGQGTFSKVKYCIDTETNEAYAVKIVDRSMIQKEKLEEQLKREIAIMKMLKHKHVIRLKEVMQSAKNIYIILELVTGVRAKRFDEKTARRYFQQLISGVEYCHSMGTSHRDLKPENLLLDENDNLKISDFGLSALYQKAGGEGPKEKLLFTTCGTPNYVAPDVLKETGYSGYAADVWSCGVILYVMLCGCLPFEDSDMRRLFAKIESGKFVIPDYVSSGAKSLISRMLTVNPKDRITVKEILDDPWFKVDFVNENLTETTPKPVVTDEKVQNAITNAKESNSSGELDNQPASRLSKHISSNSKILGNVKGAAPLNAFDILSKMLTGTFNPLVSMVRVRRETQFVILGSADKVVQQINSVLQGMNANPTIKDYDIKGFLQQGETVSTFSVDVSPTVGGYCFVEVRRGRGDILRFHTLYHDIVNQLGSDVISKSV